jgi:hypothetical protein
MLAPWKSLSSSNSVPTAPLYMPLKAINMCLASTLISVLSVLNFSLAALLAVTRRTTILGLPIGFFTIAWHKMCAVHDTCYRLARLRRRFISGLCSRRRRRSVGTSLYIKLPSLVEGGHRIVDSEYQFSFPSSLLCVPAVSGRLFFPLFSIFCTLAARLTKTHADPNRRRADARI